MYKHHQSASLILQFVNGEKAKVTNVSKGTTERNYRNGIWSYTNKNTIAKNLFDPESFYGSCPNIDWIHDFSPIIRDFKAGEIISIIVTLFFERNYKTFIKGNDTFTDDAESTKIDIRVVAKKSNNILSLNRSLYHEGILSTTDTQKKIREEIKQLNLYLSQYSIYSIQNPMQASIILPAGTGGIFVHEAIGHCLEADQYFKKNAVFNGCLGKTITKNKTITISDSCCSTDMVKFKISDDGSIPHSVTLVKGGYLENIMTDAYFSSVYGIADSGNGRSADFYSFPIPRMRNTYIHNGTDKVEDIIKSTKYGLIPIDIQGGNVTVETGNFVFNISHALIIQNGEIVGISSPFLFSGNIINALDSIERIGNDLKFCRAVCGKRGQLIDVAYGAPTVLISQRKSYE